MSRSTILVTRRLRLRNWRLSDSSSYHKHCNTPEVMHYLGGVVSKRDVRAEIKWYQWHQAKYGHTFWVVERKRDQALLGFCGIIRIPEAESSLRGALEIGWRMRADCWKQGYGFEAAVAVLDWAEAKFPDEHIVTRISRGNKASRALAQKLAMRRDRRREAAESDFDPDLTVSTKCK